MPHAALIDAYGKGGFRFADMSHRGSILCLPTATYPWAAQVFEDVTSENLQLCLNHTPSLSFLLLGTGTHMQRINPQLRLLLRSNGIHVEEMDTGAASRTYNIMLAERRSVAAALLAVE